MASVRQVYDTFIGEPIQYRHFGLAWFRLSQLMHDRTNGLFDRVYIWFVRLLWPTRTLPASKQMTPSEIDTTLHRLRSEGCDVLPMRLSDDELAALRAFMFSQPAYGVNLDSNIAIAPDKVPCDEGRYYWRVEQVIKLPVVQRLIKEGPFCAIAQDYLGCRPVLSNIVLWLDPPYEGYTPHSWHYDNDGPGFLKFFFYLTDMDVGTGAHYFIKGTHPHRKPSPFAKSGIYDEKKLFDFFDRKQEFVAAASAGTILAEDTAGFHRGSSIKSGFRLIMQWQFSVIDIPEETELRKAITPVYLPGLDPNVAQIVRKYYTTRPNGQ